MTIVIFIFEIGLSGNVGRKGVSRDCPTIFFLSLKAQLLDSHGLCYSQSTSQYVIIFHHTGNKEQTHSCDCYLVKDSLAKKVTIKIRDRVSECNKVAEYDLWSQILLLILFPFPLLCNISARLYLAPPPNISNCPPVNAVPGGVERGL